MQCTVAHPWDVVELWWAHACTRACACMRAYLFPFLSLKTQSYVCFTNMYDRICSLFVLFYEVMLIRCRSSDNWHTHMHTCAHVYKYKSCFLSDYLCVHDSCLSNSVCLLDTGILVWLATSCRPCHPAVLPGFHHCCECACLSCLFTMYCSWGKLLNVCECVYVWVYMTAVWPNIKCLLHMDSTWALYIQASGHTDVHVQTDRPTQWMD